MKAATHLTAFIGLNGTGAPYQESEMASAFQGLELESTSADMVRADILGKDIRISSAQEDSALGAIFLAGIQQDA